MGLIGAWLGGLYVGYAAGGDVAAGLPGAAASAGCRRSIATAARSRPAPNFAYELCLKRIDDAALAGLDLSCWRLAFNGAEAVSPDTVRRFAAALRALRSAARGRWRRSTAWPKRRVGLLFPPLGRAAPRSIASSATPSRANAARVPAAAADADCAALRRLRRAACRSRGPHRRRRRATKSASASKVGSSSSGPSATHGYFRNPQQTARLIHDGWLDTGDRAYGAGGEIYITGRVKDIVIRGGRNLYPQEIEEAVGQCRRRAQGLRGRVRQPRPGRRHRAPGGAGRERAPATRHRGALRDAVSRAVFAAIGEPPDEVVLAPPHTVLKTSSGKVRRSACRELYEAGRIGAARADGAPAGAAPGAGRGALWRAARRRAHGRCAVRRLLRRCCVWACWRR